MEVCQEYYGLPPPPGAFGPFLRLSLGDIVELTKAEAEQNWWEVRPGAVEVMEPGCGCPWGVGSWPHWTLACLRHVWSRHLGTVV